MSLLAVTLCLGTACKKKTIPLAGVQSLEFGNYFRKDLIWQKPAPQDLFVWESGQIIYLKKESKSAFELIFAGRFSLSMDGPDKSNRVDVDCSLKGDHVRFAMGPFSDVPVSFVHTLGPCAEVGNLQYKLKYTSFQRPSEDGFSLIGQLNILGTAYSFEERYAKGYP